MAKQDILVGLDLGTTKICAVVGRLTENDDIDIVGMGISPSTGLRKGVVVNIDQTVASIKKALEDASQMADCTIHTVFVGIAGSHIQSMNSHGIVAINNPEVTERVVARALDAAKAVAIPQDREVIHTIPQEYVVDNQRGIIQPIGMSGVRLEVKVHIVTAAVSSVQNIIRCCSKSNLDVQSIILESLASAQAVLTDEEREIGVALVDLGGGTCDITIITNGTTKYTAVLGCGGQNLTNDIAVVMGTPMAAAESLKTEYGCALASMVRPDDYIEVPGVGGREPRKLQRQVLAEICQPRMAEILTLIDNELEKSGYKQSLGAGVVLTGGTSLLPGMAELGETIFALPVRLGYPRNVTGMKDFVNSPKFATAVGLLRFGAVHGDEFSGTKSEEGVISAFFKWLKQTFGG